MSDPLGMNWLCHQCKRSITTMLDMAAASLITIEAAAQPEKTELRICFHCSEELLEYLNVSKGDDLEGYAEDVAEIKRGIQEEQIQMHIDLIDMSDWGDEDGDS